MQPKKSPAELAVALFCHGMRIASSCDIHQDGRPLIGRRAGLGSGLELIIPGERKHIWVSVVDVIETALAAK